MIYRGFNKVEVDRISKILEAHRVVYHVSVPEDSLEYMNDNTKRVNHRFMDNLLQIEIEKEEFEKIPASDLSRLFDLRIYPEEESPFTDEELGLVQESSAEVKATSTSHTKLNQLAAILAIGLVIGFSLWRKGFFN